MAGYKQLPTMLMYNKNNYFQSCMATRLPSWAYLGLRVVFLVHTVMSSFLNFFQFTLKTGHKTCILNIHGTCISRTVLVALNKIVTNKMELEGEEFDIAEDLERSMEMFTGMLRAKDEEIEVLETR